LANHPRRNKSGNPEIPVLITTAHRGVFFGYTNNPSGKTVVLNRARCCIYWPASNKGFVGLASAGPLEGAKIGPATGAMTLHDVTCAIECSPEAVKRWEAAPWK
jgi:hypothetical protein